MRLVVANHSLIFVTSMYVSLAFVWRNTEKGPKLLSTLQTVEGQALPVVWTGARFGAAIAHRCCRTRPAAGTAAAGWTCHSRCLQPRSPPGGAAPQPGSPPWETDTASVPDGRAEQSCGAFTRRSTSPGPMLLPLL